MFRASLWNQTWVPIPTPSYKLGPCLSDDLLAPQSPLL